MSAVCSLAPPPVLPPLSLQHARNKRLEVQGISLWLPTRIDNQGRIMQEQVDSLEAVTYSYDARGRLQTVI